MKAQMAEKHEKSQLQSNKELIIQEIEEPPPKGLYLISADT